MYDWMPDPPIAWRSAERDKAEGSGTWWNHKWNAETPRPWSKAFSHCVSTTKAGRQVLYQQSGRKLSYDPFQKREKTSGILPAIAWSVCSAVLGKLLERIINKRLTWHLESNSVPAPTQTGCRQFWNTVDQLALLTQDIEDAFQEEKKLLAVFFDLSKAFDKVWKEGLLLMLMHAGVHGKLYKWLSDFLFNRTAIVKVDGMISRQVKLKEGVPQGGVVSLTLFQVYINITTTVQGHMSNNDITTTVQGHVSNTLHAGDLQYGALKNTPLQLSTASRTLSTRCAVGLRAGHYSSTQPRRSALFTLSTAKE